MTKFCLTVTCPSRRGIVAAISTFLADHACNITDSAQFDDQETGQFFMRISFVPEDGAVHAGRVLADEVLRLATEGPFDVEQAQLLLAGVAASARRM